jgi:hypothetical protein
VPFPVEVNPTPLELVHKTQGLVPTFLRLATLADADLWEQTWQPLLRSAGRADGEWAFRAHIERALREDGWLCLVVEREHALEAWLSLSRAPSRLSPSQELLYVEYVGIAPQNQLPPVGQRVLKGLGRILIVSAIELSQKLGLDGRIGLHSKKEVEGFYRSLGLKELFYEPTEDGEWLYFEGGPEEAKALLALK